MSEVFERDSFFWAYVKWHYGRGIKELFGVSSNFLWFISNFFSFKLLIKTLFAPWKRLGERYQGGFNFGAFAGTFIINSLMRIVGFITKTIVLIVGFVSYTVLALFAFCIFIIWISAPIILLGSLLLAVTFFIV
jgi:hypothetical protein